MFDLRSIHEVSIDAHVCIDYTNRRPYLYNLANPLYNDTDTPLRLTCKRNNVTLSPIPGDNVFIPVRFLTVTGNNSQKLSVPDHYYVHDDIQHEDARIYLGHMFSYIHQSILSGVEEGDTFIYETVVPLQYHTNAGEPDKWAVLRMNLVADQNGMNPEDRLEFGFHEAFKKALYQDKE